MQKRGRTHPVIEMRQKRILALADGTRSRRDIADKVGVSVEDIDHDLHTLRRQGHSPQLLYTRGRRSTQDNETRLLGAESLSHSSCNSIHVGQNFHVRTRSASRTTSAGYAISRDV